MKLLIIGAGMYVTGRNDTGMGTVLTAVMQTLQGSEHEILVCATKPDNDAVVSQAAERIRAELGVGTAVSYQAYDGSAAGLKRLLEDTRPDAAIVSTPDHLHFEQISALLESGVHVLSVKPLVPTVEEHKRLIGLAMQNNVYGAVEFHKRWDESNRHVKKAIDEGVLGQLHNITVDYSQRISIPLEVFAGWADKTNIFQYLGIHYVDLVHYLTGARPFRLMVRGTKGVLAAKGLDTCDSVHVWLEWRSAEGSEFLSQYNLSWIDPITSSAMSDQKFSILATGGRYLVDQKHRGIEASLHGANGVQQINPWFSEVLPDATGGVAMQGYGFSSINTYLKDVTDLMEGKRTPAEFEGCRPTFADCLASTAVIETVNRCLAQNTQVPVSVEF